MRGEIFTPSAHSGDDVTLVDVTTVVAFGVIFAIFTVGYHHLFDVHVGINSAHWLGRMATRIYLPDSELYSQLFSAETIDQSTVAFRYQESHNPNLFGISALATFLENAGIDAYAFNIVLVLATAWHLMRLAKFHGAPSAPCLAALLLNPSTVYYSQTFTKEIILVFLTILLFRFADDPTLPFKRLWILATIFAAAVVRVEAAAPGLLVLGTLNTNANRRWMLFWLGFVALCAVLPLGYRFGLLSSETVENFRRDAPSLSGLGALVDAGLRNIPFSGLVLLPIRGFQNATEPFPQARIEDLEPGTINVYGLVLLGTFLVMIRFVIDFGRTFYRLALRRSVAPHRLHRLVFGVSATWVMVATNPFVHTRYLFNVLPLIALAPSAYRSVARGEVVARSGVRNGGTIATAAARLAGAWDEMPTRIAWAVFLGTYVILFIVRYRLFA
jgi:hypothetical protein